MEVEGGLVKLHQIAKKRFVLESRIYYIGDTGLDGKLDAETREDIRTLPAGIKTDLVSVPGPLRWFLGTYGVHPPAVLIHDRLIPTPEHLTRQMTDQYADRYLRFMVKDLEVRWLKRWVMWSGVALRTRWAGGGLRKLSVALWVVAAVIGMIMFARAAIDGDVSGMLLATAGVFVFAGLWNRQYGAGIIGGLAAPWLLPPAIMAVAGLGIHAVLEFIFGWAGGLFGKSEVRGSGSYGAEGFRARAQVAGKSRARSRQGRIVGSTRPLSRRAMIGS